MSLPGRIHIVGASGSGTTTLGRALAPRLEAVHLDTDDFFWLPTDPPYRTSRPVEARVAMLREALSEAPRWVLSGSLVKWGDGFIGDFERVVFLRLDPEVRIARLRAREQARHGAEIAPGGRLHDHHLAFIAWAQSYDRDDFDGRSLKVHRDWLARLPCPVLELDSAASVAANVEAVLAWAPTPPPSRR